MLIASRIRARLNTINVIAGIAAVGFALRLLVLLRPISVIDRLFIPDDTYYTLTIARSLAHGHGPTVDGHTFTSGFQPLLAFLMVPVFWLTDDPDTALRADLALLIVVDTMTIVALAWLAYRLGGPVAAATAAALWAVSPVAISMALGGLETSLAILFEISLVGAWIWARQHPTRRRWIIVGVIAGFTVLARIDAVLLVALLGAVQLWRGPRRPLLPVGFAATAVVAPWWVCCVAALGTPIPTSGGAAHDLALLRPFSRDALAQVAGAVAGGPFALWRGLRDVFVDDLVLGMVTFWAFVVILLAMAWWWSRRHDSTVAVATLPAFAAGLLLFYAWFGVGWHFARYLAPVAVVPVLMLSALVARVARSEHKWRVPVLAIIGVVAIVPLTTAVGADARSLSETRARFGIFDSQTGYRDVALVVVRSVPAGSVVGAWQSGAYGYFADGRITVVNLDGVVNPDATDAARAGRFAFYIHERGIGWLSDYCGFIDGFTIRDSQKLDPVPTVERATRLPQFPPFPTYCVVRINWHEDA